jgi:hypothetical protein
LGFVVAWIACGNAEARSYAALATADTREEDRRRGMSALRWMRRGYKIYDKSSSANDWINWILSLFKTKVASMAAVAAVGTAGTVGVVAIQNKIEALKSPPAVETAAIPPAAPEVRQTRNSTVFAIEGKDKAGRHASFDVVVLNKSFLWVRGSAEDLEKDGKPIARADLAAAVLDDEVNNALSDAKEVITVGTASQEGNAADEVARAERRAKQAATLVSDAVAPSIPIWTLNLGQYRDPCKDCETGGTSWQRPFIVIAVKEADLDTNIGEALADAMSGKEKLPSPNSYSVFALTKFR